MILSLLIDLAAFGIAALAARWLLHLSTPAKDLRTVSYAYTVVREQADLFLNRLPVWWYGLIGADQVGWLKMKAQLAFGKYADDVRPDIDH